MNSVSIFGSSAKQIETLRKEGRPVSGCKELHLYHNPSIGDVGAQALADLLSRWGWCFAQF